MNGIKASVGLLAGATVLSGAFGYAETRGTKSESKGVQWTGRAALGLGALAGTAGLLIWSSATLDRFPKLSTPKSMGLGAAYTGALILAMGAATLTGKIAAGGSLSEAPLPIPTNRPLP